MGKSITKNTPQAPGFVPRPLADNSDQVVAEAWQQGLPDLPARGIPLFSLLDVVANLSQKFHRDTLKPLGYTHTDYVILATLLLNGGNMQPSFFTRMLDSASAATSQTLKKLEAQGLLSREASPSDRRSVLVGLTGKGKQEAKRLCEAEALQSERLTRDLSEQDLQDLRQTLRRLVKVLK